MRAFKAPLVAAGVASVVVVLSPALASSAGGASRPTTVGWISVVPAKRTVSGVVGGGCVAQRAADACSVTASIFPNAPRNVSEATMGVQGGTFENPYCAGDIARPAPEAGYLCIYPNQPELVNVGLTTEGLLNAEPHPIYNGRRGFKIVWTAQAPGTTQFYAVWTYRAP